MILLPSVEWHRRVKGGVAARVGAALPVRDEREAFKAVSAEAERREARQELGYGAYLTAHRAGRLCTLKMPASRDSEKPGGIRGKVVGFSHSSRLRMMRKIHTIERSALMPFFVTLTFPDLFPDFTTAKKRLDTLFKRWKRKWPTTSALWRMELIDRKSGSMVGQVAPHFHLLVWGAFDPEEARNDWFEVCGSDDYAHFKYGSHSAKLLHEWKEAAAYCAKYCAKESTSEATASGRVWGVHNKSKLPIDREPVVVRLHLGEAFKVRRVIRKAIRAKTGKEVRCAHSLYTSAPDDLCRYIASLRGIVVSNGHGRIYRPQIV